MSRKSKETDISKLRRKVEVIGDHLINLQNDYSANMNELSKFVNRANRNFQKMDTHICKDRAAAEAACTGTAKLKSINLLKDKKFKKFVRKCVRKEVAAYFKKMEKEFLEDMEKSQKDHPVGGCISGRIVPLNMKEISSFGDLLEEIFGFSSGCPGNNAEKSADNGSSSSVAKDEKKPEDDSGKDDEEKNEQSSGPDDEPADVLKNPTSEEDMLNGKIGGDDDGEDDDGEDDD